MNDHKLILWQNLDEKECTIDEIEGLEDFYKKIIFYRDKNYKLKFKISHEFADPVECHKLFFSDSHRHIPGHPINNYIKIKAHGDVPLDIYTSKSLLVNRTQTKGNEVTLSGELFELLSFYDFEEYRKEAGFSIYWFLNGDENFKYSRSLIIEYSTNATIKISGFSSENSILNQGSQSSVNSFAGKIDGADFALGYVENKITNNFIGTYIRFNNLNLSNQSYLESIIELFSFLTGKSFIPIGKTIYNNLYSPVEKQYISSYRDDIDHVINRASMYPIPITYNETHINIELLFSDLLSKYHMNKEKFALNEAIQYLLLSDLLPIDTQIQPLSTALDILKKAWFKSERSQSKGKNLDDEIYKSIISKYIDKIKEEIQNKSITNKISSANQMGDNEKTLVFLKELDIDIGAVEKVILRERNKAIHGYFKEQKDYNEIFIRAKAYRTLLNKIILKIIGYNDYYIDYSTYGFPVRKMADVLGGPNDDFVI